MDNNKIEIPELSKDDIERYCRQMLLTEISSEGQKNLKSSKLLVVGAGGLGAPCLFYLSGAGVSTIGIVDGDTIDTSNLHRQIIHQSQNKGMSKSKSAAEAIKLLNPLVNVIHYEHHLSKINGIEICQEYDLLIDCSDNPATRYLISDIAVILNIPLISGSAVKLEGQLTVYVSNKVNKFKKSEKSDEDKSNQIVPCYRCLFPIPTPNSAVCNCSDAGVFGPVPGVIGTMQASEAIKIIVGHGEKTLSNKMLYYDGWDTKFKIFKIRNKQKDCISCGENPKITRENIKEYDYAEFVNPTSCRIPLRVDIPKENNIKWIDFIKNLDNKDDNKTFVDVRSTEQFNIYHIDKFKNIPLKELRDRFDSFNDSLPKDKTIFVMCKRGNNSTHAVKFLLEKGYIKIYNIEGGIFEYKNSINSECPEY